MRGLKKLEQEMIDKISNQLFKDNWFRVLRPRARKRYIEEKYPSFKDYSGTILEKYKKLKRMEKQSFTRYNC